MNLPKIEGNTPMEKVFKEYLAETFFTYISCRPDVVSMRELKEEDHSTSAQIVYNYMVLRNALVNATESVKEFISLVNEFTDKYNSDWYSFSAAKYEEVGNEYGFDPGMTIEDFTLIKELRIALRVDDRGEGFGVSEAEHFSTFSQLVKEKEEMFSLRKVLPGIQVHKRTDEGEMEPLSLGEQIEGEINQGLSDAKLVDCFNAIIDKLHSIRCDYLEQVTDDPSAVPLVLETRDRLNEALQLTFVP